jgi:hypothetical protein
MTLGFARFLFFCFSAAYPVALTQAIKAKTKKRKEMKFKTISPQVKGLACPCECSQNAPQRRIARVLSSLGSDFSGL